MTIQQKLVFFVGPTAVGKSALAMQLAIKHNAVIFNADSVQVYTRLNIGAAKPSAQERQAVQHELFDIVNPPDTLTAGRYHTLARAEIEKWWRRKPIFVVGGSGFYLQALEKGMFSAPAANPQIVAKWTEYLTKCGQQDLHAELVCRDPVYAAKIPDADTYRIIRALTLFEETGKSMRMIQDEFDEIKKQKSMPWPHLKIGLSLSRAQLRDRVRARVQAMRTAGLEQEVADLVKDGFSDWGPMSSVGYKETLQYLKDQVSATQWLENIETSTMQLAKKQMTWFKRDPSIFWFDAQLEWSLALAKVEDHLLTQD
jgi:tRNA dimethylallyltransferase